MSFLQGSGIDFKATLASGVTALGIDYGLYGMHNKAAVNDAINHAGANVAAQVTNIGQFIPVPGELASVTTDIAAGLGYCLLNKVNETSPFGDNCLSNFLYGTATSILSYNVTERVFTSL